MRRVGVAMVLAGVSLFALGLVGLSRASGQTPQVTFCHRTASVSNPYNLITASGDSIIQAGHSGHTGPVYPAPGWGDIIPPFTYSGGTFPGYNWNPAGMAILNSGCDPDPTPPTSTTTTTTTTVAPTTTTSTPGPTTTATTPPSTAPGSSVSVAETTTSVPGTTPPGGTTTVPGSGTTLPVPPTAPTLPPPSTVVPPTVAPQPDPPLPPDPPGGQEVIPPPVDAEVIEPGDQVENIGTLDPSERQTLEQEVDPVPSGAPSAGLGGASRSTGVNAGWATAGGILLTVAGVATLVLWRRRSSA